MEGERRGGGRWSGNSLSSQKRKWRALFLLDGTRNNYVTFYILPAFLRCNLHTIKFTLLTYNTTLISKFTEPSSISVAKGRASVSICNYSLFPPPAPGNHEHSCLYRFAFSRHFAHMESYNMWSFISGFFHIA